LSPRFASLQALKGATPCQPNADTRRASWCVVFHLGRDVSGPVALNPKCLHARGGRETAGTCLRVVLAEEGSPGWEETLLERARVSASRTLGSSAA
jgi:hypothetical protein